MDESSGGLIVENLAARETYRNAKSARAIQEKPIVSISPRPVSTAQRLLPVLGWLPLYRREWLVPDVLAGLAIWAVMVPEGMAYAGIVGVPAINGLYTIVPPLLAYAILGTSRLLVVGPDTATGLISALTVGAIAAQSTVDFNALTSTLAVLIGVLFLLFGVLRMGWVAAFIPTPVMRGFIEGLVCVTIIGQVPHLLGISGTTGNLFMKLRFLLQQLPDVSLAPVLTGLLSLLAMLLLRHLAPRVPSALVIAVLTTVVSQQCCTFRSLPICATCSSEAGWSLLLLPRSLPAS